MSSRPTILGQGTEFESYAISKTWWATLNELSSQDWVPRHVRLRAQKVDVATHRLIQEFKLPPQGEEEEIAEELGTVAEYQGFLGQYSRPQVASFEARLELTHGKAGIECGALVEDSSAVDPQSHTNLESCASTSSRQ
jgi:DNA-directed RNA polymerase specialized sigma subunit